MLTSSLSSALVAPLAADQAVAPAKPLRKAEWNPRNLGMPALPSALEPFTRQFEPNYLTTAPTYLDGKLSGDVGFDPWALAVLANPALSPGALLDLDAKSRTATERNSRMLALPAEEQTAKLQWMRSSEIKHGRLAMCANPSRAPVAPATRRSKAGQCGCPG